MIPESFWPPIIEYDLPEPEPRTKKQLAKFALTARATVAPGANAIIVLTGLPIGENAGVVALERVVEDVSAQSVEHMLLRGEVVVIWVDRAEAMVESEGFWLLSVN